MSKEGIIFIKWEPRPKLPRKKKKQFIKYMGPKVYKRYLLGEPDYLLTSDYVNINGVSYAPWNKKVWRKEQNKLSRYAKKHINSRYYTKILNPNKDE
tara:strand:- start:328 stop:618 length:291 start_codon:yes stop_codon:yes gene_type:complete